jgi:hypothetical protein
VLRPGVLARSPQSFGRTSRTVAIFSSKARGREPAQDDLYDARYHFRVSRGRPNYFLLTLSPGDGLPSPAFLDRSQRKRVLRQVYRLALRQWQTWVAVLAAIAVNAVGFTILHRLPPTSAAVELPIIFALQWVGGAIAARITLSRWRREFSRQLAGLHLCPACGYDLRATPERCPECGTIPDAVKRDADETVRVPRRARYR